MTTSILLNNDTTNHLISSGAILVHQAGTCTETQITKGISVYVTTSSSLSSMFQNGCWTWCHSDHLNGQLPCLWNHFPLLDVSDHLQDQFLHLKVGVCMYVHVRACVHSHMCMHMRVCACVHTCVSLNVCFWWAVGEGEGMCVLEGEGGTDLRCSLFGLTLSLM